MDNAHWVVPIDNNGKVKYTIYDFSKITGSIDQVGWDPKTL